MIDSQYRETLLLIERYSWRINSLIGLIDHNRAFYSKFPNSKQSEKADKDNQHYLKQIEGLNQDLKKELDKLIKII